jgi:hypothetical protein
MMGQPGNDRVASGHRIRRVHDRPHGDDRAVANRPVHDVQTLEPFRVQSPKARLPQTRAGRLTLLGWVLAMLLAMVAGVLLVNVQ